MIAAGRLRLRPGGGTPRSTSDAPSTQVGTLVLVGLLVGGWQFASTRTYVIPSVPSTLSALRSDLADGAYRAQLRYTVADIGQAVAISLALGAGIGLILGSVPVLRRAVEPVVISLNAVPKIIVYPMLLPVLHVGTRSQIVMGVLHGTFPMLIMVSAAVADVPPIYVRMARSLGATRRQVLWSITLPAIRKPFLTGARLAVSLASIGVLLAEFFSSREGLGRMMAQSYEFAQYDALMATTLVLLAVSFVGSYLLWLAERRPP